MYRSPNIDRLIKSRRLRWAGHVGRMEDGRNTLKILAGKTRERRSLGRPWRRWQGIIRMDLTGTGLNTRNWVHSADDRNYWRALVNVTLNLRVP